MGKNRRKQQRQAEWTGINNDKSDIKTVIIAQAILCYERPTRKVIHPKTARSHLHTHIYTDCGKHLHRECALTATFLENYTR